MTMSDHVSLTISQDSVGVSRAGFGVPLVLSHNAAFAARVEYVTSLADLVALGFATSSPEYLACSALLAQNPHPSRIAIGRAALKPTQKYEWTPVAKNTHIYILNVKGQGVTAEAVDITSDASATIAEICTAMTAALNAVVGKNYTAVDGVTKITITGTAAGDWFSIGQEDITDGKIEQTHVDPGVATDLAAIVLAENDWYCLLTLYNSSALVQAAAAWIETQKKIYIVDIADSEAVTTVVTTSDLMDDLHTSALERTSAWFHPEPAEMLAAAVAGRCLPKDPGSVTFKFKTLSGVDPVALTTTHLTNMRAKKGNSYQTVGGVNITLEGYRADGDFLDATRDLDWLENDMQIRVFGTLAGADKIPYTDPGIAVIQADVEASLDYAVTKGVLAESPAPTVEVPAAASVAAVDKAARLLTDVKFTGTLAGAIHKVTINGTVSV